MKLLLLISIAFFTVHLHAQQYAGEDKIACQGPGAAIGIENPNPDHCYVWSIKDGLTIDQVNQKNPIVHPENTTTYTVTVTDQFFSFKSIDHVTVEVYFGGVEFSPKYALPNGAPLQTKATLTSNGLGGLPPDPHTWSIANDIDNTGCDIDPQTGWISGCNSSGRVVFKATNDEDPSCFAQDTLDVNIGVKDIIVRDQANEGRLAHAGDTLYILLSNINGQSVQFQAIPNDESSFPVGQPEWSGSPSAPPGGGPTWIAEVGLGIHTVQAGDKKVTVAIAVGASVTIQKSIDIDQIKQFKKKFDPPSLLNLTSPYCNPIPIGFNLPADNVTLGVVFEDVNKYKSRFLGKKIDFAISLPAFGATGCLPIVNLMINYFIPGGAGSVRIFPYVRTGASITISGNYTKNESLENSDWIGSVNGIGKVDLAAGAAADISAGPFGLAAGSEVATDVSLKCRLKEGKVEANLSWGGLQAKLGGLLYFGPPTNPTWTLPFEATPVNILDGAETPYRTFIDLNVD